MHIREFNGLGLVVSLCSIENRQPKGRTRSWKVDSASSFDRSGWGQVQLGFRTPSLTVVAPVTYRLNTNRRRSLAIPILLHRNCIKWFTCNLKPVWNTYHLFRSELIGDSNLGLWYIIIQCTRILYGPVTTTNPYQSNKVLMYDIYTLYSGQSRSSPPIDIYYNCISLSAAASPTSCMIPNTCQWKAASRDIGLKAESVNEPNGRYEGAFSSAFRSQRAHHDTASRNGRQWHMLAEALMCTCSGIR